MNTNYNHETNEFLLCALNTEITYHLVMTGRHAAKVFNSGRCSVFKHIKAGMINFDDAEKYFEQVRLENERER